ncbi:MAG: YHS domain-containing protein, partial [Tumebacillaceae bacterium]
SREGAVRISVETMEALMTTDPVCGKPVQDENSMNKVDYMGRTFYFCSQECEEVFETDPAPYAQAAS